MTMQECNSEGVSQEGRANFLTKSKRPWVKVYAQMPDHVMTLAGISARKFYWDARTLVDSTAEVTAYYDMDQLVPFADLYNFEIEGMGAKMVYSDNAMPTIDFRNPLVKEPDDLYNLKTPNFYRDGRLLYALDCIKFGSEYGVYESRFCAPFSMVVGMRGYPAVIKDMKKRPQFAHELLTFSVDEVLVPYLRVQKDYCRITVARGADAWASIPNLSVKELREWVVPYILRLRTKAREFGVEVISNTGDYCEECPEKFDSDILHSSFDIEVIAQGAPSLRLGMGRWQDYPLEPVRQYTAKYRQRGLTVSVTAGVNARLLRDGPVENIVGTIKRFINAFARDHELTITLANIPADTPTDHVHAAVTAAHIYGRKPVAVNLDEIEFKLPKRESFQEWKAKRLTNN